MVACPSSRARKRLAQALFSFCISNVFLPQRLVLALSTSFAIRGESRERIPSRAVAAALGGGGGVWEEGDACEGGVSSLAGGRLQGLGTNISSDGLGTCLSTSHCQKRPVVCQKRPAVYARCFISRNVCLSLSFHLALFPSTSFLLKVDGNRGPHTTSHRSPHHLLHNLTCSHILTVRGPVLEILRFLDHSFASYGTEAVMPQVPLCVFVLSFGMLPTHMHIKRQRISGLFLALCLIHTQATRQRMIQSPLSMLLQGKPNLELEQYTSAAAESMAAAAGKAAAAGLLLQHERDSLREKAESQQLQSSLETFET